MMFVHASVRKVSFKRPAAVARSSTVIAAVDAA
jgi:hypothetical protein